MIFRHVRRLVPESSGVAMVESSFGGFTVAVEELRGWLLPTLEPGNFFEKRIGIAVCSDKDRFNKKIGRELAEKRAKLQKLTVCRVVKEPGKTTVEMQDTGGNCYTFVKYANANSVFFVDFRGSF